MAYISGVHNKTVKSNSSAGFTGPASTLVPVLDGSSVPLSCTITTHGSEVLVWLEDDGTGSGSQFGYGENGISSDGEVVFKRNGVTIAILESHHQNNVSIEELGLPPSSFTFNDTPPAGTHIYTVEIFGQPTYSELLNSVLKVKEI